jgi:class 3 adenylate cyclase
VSSIARSEGASPNPSWQWWIILTLPVIGLVLLLARPELDLHWEHHPSHFWLVLVTAAVNVALAYVTNVVATRHRDPRVVLISMAFLASAGFLGLHALATPGVLLSQPNAGFAIATPVGLVIAAGFAAASVTALAGPRGAAVLRARTVLLGGLAAAMLAWAFVSLAGLPPLGGPPPASEAAGPLAVVAVIAVGVYAFAAWRTIRAYLARGGIVTLAIGIALILLGEAMLAVAFSRNWRLSWWEWHVLMLLAFAAIALGAREEYRRSGSLSATFGGLYVDATLARVNRWHARAIADVARADERGEPADRVIAQLRREGASSDEVALVEQAAGELRRLDALFRPYLPSVVADRLRTEPDFAQGIGEERVLTVLFADLAGFTRFSESRSPAEVIAMLNAFWAEVVPAIDAAGGVVGHFAGDGVMATFNTAGDQPDHARRACRAGLAITAAAREIVAAHAGWPTFRVGVNTGPAVVGHVGSDERRVFSVIGDTTNVAARLMAVAEPGQVVISGATWAALGADRDGVALGPREVKGKTRPVEAWVLRSVDVAGPAAGR